MGLMSEQELIQKRQKWGEARRMHYRLRVHDMVENNEKRKDCDISNRPVTV